MTITREQITRLRSIGWLYGVNEHVDAILDEAKARISEQSRIDAAVAKERERCAAIADKHAAFAGLADSHIAEVAEDSMREIAREIAAAIRTPTPTTEEGA